MIIQFNGREKGGTIWKKKKMKLLCLQSMLPKWIFFMGMYIWELLAKLAYGMNVE